MGFARTETFVIDPTPKELAFEFCNMNSEDQAEFFNNLAEITKNWEVPLVMQLQAITDEKSLTDDARDIMDKIGMYAEKTDTRLSFTEAWDEAHRDRK